MFKSCTKCFIEQSFESFHKDKYNPSGRKSVCKSCISIHYQENKQTLNELNKEYKKRTNYVAVRRKNDPCFRIAQNLRARLSRIIARNAAGASAIKDLGCSVEELKIHLESLFQANMSWDNYGKWEIDHIIPLSSVNTKEEVLKLCHYSNLQPLWKTQNRIKFNKVA